jgi:hypothetical protein
VADGANKNSAVNLVRLAVGIARVINKCGYAVSIDGVLAVAEPKQVRARRMLVDRICLVIGYARSGILGHNRTLLNGSGCVNAVGVNFGPADNQSHGGASFLEASSNSLPHLSHIDGERL